jgi:predicted RecB family nuclease
MMSVWDAKPTTFALETHIREARRYLRQLTAMNDQPTQPRYYRNDHCNTCPNKTDCLNELTSKDDLSLLVSMNPVQIEKLNARGILTVNQLSYTFRYPKNRTTAPQLARPIYALKALALREKQTYILESPIFPDHPTEIFVDFEGFPDERCVYLIGMIVREKQKEITKTFWAESLNDTDSIMIEFLRELRSIGVYTMYHFGSFEARALQSFGRQTENSLSDEIVAILAKSVNVLTLFSQNVYPPTYSNGLKEIAGFLGFKWTTPDISGQESIVLRQKWELDGLETTKSTLIRYNLGGCPRTRF